MPLTPPPGLPAYPPQNPACCFAAPCWTGNCRSQGKDGASASNSTTKWTHCIADEQLHGGTQCWKEVALHLLCCHFFFSPSEFGNNQRAAGRKPLWAGQQATGTEVSLATVCCNPLLFFGWLRIRFTKSGWLRWMQTVSSQIPWHSRAGSTQWNQ